MGFVVKKFPLRSGIVLEGAVGVVGEGEGFRTGSQKEILGAGSPDANGTRPDNFSNICGFGAADFQSGTLDFIGRWGNGFCEDDFGDGIGGN